MRGALYPWQEECLNRWLDNQGRGVIQAVTGSGKTVLALAAIERLEKICDGDLQIRIVVPTGALMRQWQKTLKQWLSDSTEYTNGAESVEEYVTICGAGYYNDKVCKYMIYVINSARYRLARQLLQELQEDKKVFLIADECHHYDSVQNRLIFEFLPHVKQYENHFFSMGLSATLPKGEKEEYLTSVLGSKIYHYGMKEATAKNTICRYDIFHISIDFSDTEADEYREITERMKYAYTFLRGKGLIAESGTKKELFERMSTLSKHPNVKIASMAANYMKFVYQREKLVCLASARVPCAYHLIMRLGIREKILVFCERISQADELYERLKNLYVGKVGRYHSHMGQQANYNTLERFRTGELRVLITCKSVDEGVDIPDVSIGIVLSGTAAQRQRIQRLGRVVRRAEGKSRATLYYLHLEGSSEERIFLPEMEQADVLELEYYAKGDKLLHSVYDKKAKALLRNLCESGANEELLEEAGYVLELGKIRTDWMKGRCDYVEKLKYASGVRERNYWMCMKRLSQIL